MSDDNNDLHNALLGVRVISPISQAGNAAMVGAIMDMQGYGAAEFFVTLGTITTAGTAYTILLEEGDAANLSDAAAVADADLLGTEALASFIDSEINTTKRLGYKGNKRYIRLTATPSGNTGASTFSAICVKGNAALQGTV